MISRKESLPLHINTLVFLSCLSGHTLHVGRFMYGDGHMICGKVAYPFGKAYFGYNNKEFESRSFYVLVEHARSFARGLSKRDNTDEFPELPGVEQPKRAPILK